MTKEASKLKSFNAEDLTKHMLAGLGVTDDPDDEPIGDTIEFTPDEAPASEGGETEEGAEGEEASEESAEGVDDELESLPEVDDGETVALKVDGEERVIPKADLVRYAQIGLHHTQRGATLNQREQQLRAREAQLEEERVLAANFVEFERRLDDPAKFREIVHAFATQGSPEVAAMRRQVLAEVVGVRPAADGDDEGTEQPRAPSRLENEVKELKGLVTTLLKDREETQSRVRTESLRSRLNGSLDRHKGFIPEGTSGRDIVAEMALDMMRAKPNMDIDLAVDTATGRLRTHIKQLTEIREKRSEKSGGMKTMKSSDGKVGTTPAPEKLSYKELGNPAQFAGRIMRGLFANRS